MIEELLAEFKALINENQLLGGGLMLMFVGWFGYQLRALPVKIQGLFVLWAARSLVIRDDSQLYEGALDLVTKCSISKQGPKNLELRDSMNGATGEKISKIVASDTSFWGIISGKLSRIDIVREESESNKSSFGSVHKPWKITITIYLGTRRTIEKLSTELHKRTRHVKPEGVRIVSFTSWGDQNELFQPNRPMHTICMEKEQRSSITGAIDIFLKSQKEYASRAQPWRFGVLLTGSPGIGKTSLIHALATRYERDVYITNLSEMTGDSALMRMLHSTNEKSVIVLEDVDCLFKERKTEESEHVTFSGLLNAIDGIGSPAGGRILMMTTNHPEKLDPALIRPGRIDFRMEIQKPTRLSAEQYILDCYPQCNGQAEGILDKIFSYSEPTGAELEAGIRNAIS